MTNTKHTFFSATVVLLTAMLLSACVNEPNSPGYEYMPDMYRSPAVEAYVDYGMDPFHFGDSLIDAQRNSSSVRKPVAGTIVFSEDPKKVRFKMPYRLANTDSGYAKSAEVKSPLVETEAVIADGKVLYEKFCVQCHGPEGQGDGKVITVGNHPPPGAYDGALKDLPEGKMFHTITYGKGVMGPHASILNKEQRWKVVAYIKTLQGNEPASEDEEGGEEESPENGESADTNAEPDNQ